MTIDRRSFVSRTALGAGAFTVGGVSVARAEADAPGLARSEHEFVDRLDPALVREVVGKSHADLEGVKALVERMPELAKASYDWGFGDWESAIGAASHTGRREIAEVLIANGARPNLFTHAMLGHLEVVRATIEATPGIQRERGPHGITLLAHARFGGDASADVVAYLESLGDADDKALDLPLTDSQIDEILGEYRFGAHATDAWDVSRHRRGWLQIARRDGVARGLLHQGNYEFHPAGAPSTRFFFEFENNQPVRLRLGGSQPELIAERGC